MLLVLAQADFKYEREGCLGSGLGFLSRLCIIVVNCVCPHHLNTTFTLQSFVLISDLLLRADCFGFFGCPRSFCNVANIRFGVELVTAPELTCM